MAERKAVNKYYPPEWEPKKGSINKFRGTHPLRERARKLHQGILIIRFELPFNIWCEGCNNHVGTGVRYNAQKSKTGMYLSTPIYKFRMKCHLCDNHFEIQTDPKNHDYQILNGARRQERRWDPTQNEQVVPEDKSTTKKLEADSMFKLEFEAEDKAKAKAAGNTLKKLEKLQKRWRDDYDCNQLLRRQFRSQKKEINKAIQQDKSLIEKSSLPESFKLLPESKDDSKLAQLMKLESVESSEKLRQKNRKGIMTASIFGDVNVKNKSLNFKSSNEFLNPGTKSTTKPKGIQLQDALVKKGESKSLVPDYNDSD